MNRRRLLYQIVALMSLLCLTPLAKAQAQLNRGVFEGQVSDPQGKVVPGANITITNVETNVSATTKSNGSGYYRVVDLVPGNYRVHFELTGFAPLDLSGAELLAGRVQQRYDIEIWGYTDSVNEDRLKKSSEECPNALGVGHCKTCVVGSWFGD